jgi:hypothetical protein
MSRAVTLLNPVTELTIDLFAVELDTFMTVSSSEWCGNRFTSRVGFWQPCSTLALALSLISVDPTPARGTAHPHGADALWNPPFMLTLAWE